MTPLWTKTWLGVLALSFGLALGCSSEDGNTESASANLDEQPGDPVKGKDALLNNGGAGRDPYISCGVPWKLWSKVKSLVPDDPRIPDRSGHNADLPYYLSTATTRRGVEVVTANCLLCHGGKIDDKLIVGLGDSMRDFTFTGALTGPLQTVATKAVEKLIGLSDDEEAELERFRSHLAVTAKYVETDTVGINPAPTMFGIFAAFREPETLATRKEPSPGMKKWTTGDVAPLFADVPAWWTAARRKSSLYYGGFGRGNHARLIMQASLLCLENTDEAEAIDGYFKDVEAFVKSVEPPKFPRAVDLAAATRGEAIYGSKCESCHGSPKKNTFPDRVIPLGTVGTDALYDDVIGGEFGKVSIDWFNRSWFGTYGQKAKFELPTTPGYVAPALDGVWATAPYLHNGSIPTLEALLDSSKRPRFFKRKFDSRAYDFERVGWSYTTLGHGKDNILNLLSKKEVYDTTRPGYSNQGHTFGDTLTADDRRDLLEHLKTF